VLGFTGLAILLYTVISLMGKVEEAFNFVWRVKRQRSLLAQFRDYLSIVLAGPLLLFSALGLWGVFSQWEPVHALATLKPLALLLQTSPTILIVLAFTLLYLFMPNTQVKPWAALGGATFAGITWQIAGWLFASFVVSSGQQTAVYSLFASLFLFILWLYLGWLIVLTGARLAYYFQYPDAVHLPTQPSETSLQARELLTIAVLHEVGTRFLNKQPPVTLDELRQRIPVSRFLLETTLDDLNTYGILSRDDNEPTHYLLRVSPDKLSVADIRQRLWQGTTQQQQQATQIRVQAGISSAWFDSLTRTPDATVQQLIQAIPEQAAPPPSQT
jgi:membrane protein